MRRLLVLLFLLPTLAQAQDRRASHCIAVAEAPGVEYLHRASYRAPLPDEFTVRLNYVDHAMFLIETAGGLRAITDYSGFAGAIDTPDIVTMNRAHITHWTPDPDPAIPHVLPGWSDRVGEPVGHHLDLGEMLVRSVSTDIRGRAGGFEENGNSIFVFEVGGLCIGHLGHLHHEPDAETYAALGRLDVVMAPVDGGLTLDRPTLKRVLDRLRSSVVIPMHWWGQGSLDRFLSDMSDSFDVEVRPTSYMEVSLRSLPSRPTIVVLRPAFLSEPE
ncbi:MBL fold metallo-hydrolase [Jannaschia sp. KMU-145]|uniref:MBL fold metallo-hydrolase n=1 Tax=Jannaschia halovivens TaxID=3388667 RepID=UPI00396B3B33